MTVAVRLLTICLVLTLASAATASASAAAKTEVQRPRSAAQALLGTSHGYLVGVYFPTPKLAQLFVFKLGLGEEDGFAQAVYAVRARSHLADGELRADFGPIGRVALRFRPNGETSRGRIQDGCRGPLPLRESGRVRGTVALEGEDGYFRVSTNGGAALRERSFRLVCRRGRALNVPPNLPLRELVMPSFSVFWTSGGGGTNAVLETAAKLPGGFVALRASHQAGSPPGAEIQLGTVQVGHGMAVGRSLELDGGKGTLRTSMPGARPATATFTPPKPFHGEASYVESSTKDRSWTGSLGVRLLGLDLPLTGPGFSTSLCVLSQLKSPNGCDFTDRESLLADSLSRNRWLKWR